MSTTSFLRALLALVLAQLVITPSASAQTKRPNILWLSYEDSSPHVGAYGDEHAKTPNMDAFAKQAVRYTHAFTVAGVCAPSRSGIITGMYPTTIGSQHMRSQATLPADIKTFPTYLREAGYYCTNNSKEDYNLKGAKGTWDESSGKAHYKNRKENQPFFAVFNFTQSHESQFHGGRNFPDAAAIDGAKLTLPPYYPDTPLVRKAWAQNYQSISQIDFLIGQKLKELEEAGLAEETIVFIWSDHGDGVPRSKRWLYDTGTRIVLMARVPAKFRAAGQATPGSVSDELISGIDFGPTVLNLAGIKVPDHMQGRAFLGEKVKKPREYVFSARDRMDERYDMIRTVRDKRYRYVRNYMPWVPYSQFIHYNEQGTIAKEWRRMNDEGKLTGPAKAWFAPRKPAEELYDTQNDPWEINNLAAVPEHAQTLLRLRKAHWDWQDETRDLGFLPEAIMNEEAKAAGSQFGILRQDGGIDRLVSLRFAASIALDKASAAQSARELNAVLTSEDPAVVTWAFTIEAEVYRWLGDASKPGERFVRYMEEKDPTLRLAAARGAAMHGQAEKARPVLIEALKNENEHIRLTAALILDEMGTHAKPATSALQEAKKADKSGGKYVARVATHALNQMHGTSEGIE